MTRIMIAGTGSFLPERVVTNDELAERYPETSDEWIFSHTGISSRHIASPDETPSGIGLIAARRALEMAGVSPKELGFILVSTATPDYATVPQVSCLIQRELGATSAASFDITAACCGFVYNLEIAKGFYSNRHFRKPILVVATEMMSRRVNWNDYKSCVLFGDGAGAAVLLPSDTESGIVDTVMKTDGTGAELLKIEGGARSEESTHDPNANILQMSGHKVYTFAIKVLPEIVKELLDRNGLAVNDIDKIVPHQANYRIIHSAAVRLGFTEDMFYINVKNVANTASASIPIALDEMNRGGLLHRGDRIITVGFGAGLSYGGNYMIW